VITSHTLRLYGTNSTPIFLPNYEDMWNDTNYSISPLTYYHTNATNATFNVTCNSSLIEYYGTNISRYYNGTVTNEYFNNVTTLSAGGNLTYLANSTGIYTQCYWFKHQNYTKFSPQCNQFFIAGNDTGLAGVAGLFNTGGLMSPFGFYFVAICITMLVVGFVSRYTDVGAGLIGILILWGFTYLYPNGVLICVFECTGAAGSGLAIWMATTMTTVVTLFAIAYKTVF
jgi:hypothetical protein